MHEAERQRQEARRESSYLGGLSEGGARPADQPPGDEKRHRMRSSTLGAAALLVALGLAVVTAQRPEVGGRVFLDAGGFGAPVLVDVGLLMDTRVRLGVGERPVVRLNLAAGVELVAEIDATGPTPAGFSLTGRLVEGRPGSVTLVVNGDVIAGEVSTPGGHYAIRPAGAGAAVVREIDPAMLRPGRDDAVRPPARSVESEPTTEPIRAPGAVPAPAAPAAPAEDGSRIDVLVFYTAKAKAEDGGGTVAGIRAMIDSLIVGVNKAYADSGVVYRLNLAAQSTQAPLSGTRDDPELLTRFIRWKRGRQLRDRHSADLVALVHSAEESDVAGAAELGAPDWPDWSDWYRTWAVYSINSPFARVFAHETGHNMGLNHERYQTLVEWEGPGNLRDLWYPSGVGFAGPIDNDPGTLCVATIMAYGTECYETQEQRLLWPIRFSNPNHKVSGVRIGVRGDKPSRRTDGPAFAARHLNRMRRYAANFRRAPCLADRMRVRLQASSGEYVVAVGNGGGPVRADQPRPGPRGRFTLVDHNGGPCVASGDVVSLHTSDGFYLRAPRGGGGEVDATAPRATPWARFTARRHQGRGAFRAGDVLTLQTRSGHYLVAEEGGGGAVRADRENAGAWERFRVSR